MSAIWGCVDMASGEIPPQCANEMQAAFAKFRIDRFSAVSKPSAVMGCALQYIRSYSQNETLPIYDEERREMFTADCLVDNRSQLIAQLCPGEASIPDAALLFLAYKKWGAEMARRVYGCYSYAVWNTHTKTLLLGADHTASRAIYYKRQGSRIYFATRMESILNACGQKQLNEEWLCLFFAMKNLTILAEPLATPYKDVFRIEAAHYNVFTNEDTKAVRYWSFEDVKPLRLGSDNDYKEYFRELFTQCVNESIADVSGQTGILLSGGFDSTVTAALAAKKLAAQNKKLYGYTNVPIKGYRSPYKKDFFTADETDTMLRFCEMYPNILPQTFSLPECDGYSNVRDILSVYETPYKSLTNVDWLHSLYKKAGEQGCRVLLTGQFGNATLSWGSVEDYVHEMLHKGRLLHAVTTVNKACKLYGFSRKNYFKSLLKSYLSRTDKNEDLLQYTWVRRTTAQRLGVCAGDARLLYNSTNPKLARLSFRKHRRIAINPTAFAHIADVETQMSLQNGFVLRDPSRDIRVIEFCSAVPLQCFVNAQPQSRRLSRAYFGDLLPDCITAQTAPRGRQSADALERLLPRWAEIHSDAMRVFESEELQKYLDAERLQKSLKDFRTIDTASTNASELLPFGIAYVAGVFLEMQG